MHAARSRELSHPPARHGTLNGDASRTLMVVAVFPSDQHRSSLYIRQYSRRGSCCRPERSRHSVTQLHCRSPLARTVDPSRSWWSRSVLTSAPSRCNAARAERRGLSRTRRSAPPNDRSTATAALPVCPSCPPRLASGLHSAAANSEQPARRLRRYWLDRRSLDDHRRARRQRRRQLQRLEADQR
jgi:hypothetical protein